MIDWVIGPVTEWLVKKGAEKIQTSAEFQHSRQAIREAIFREIRFNQALIAEVMDGKTEDQAALAKCIAEEMDFSAFSKLEDSFVPIRLFFDGSCPGVGGDKVDGSYHKWSSQLKSEAEWVERIYLRTRILRARWRSGQPQSEKSVRYVKWLMVQWLKSLQPASTS
ncbi:MAG: hypothetical protein IE913_11690 [Halothiobacillus sp.]|nr:hypothetical protein [Halothiobacillus sp.]